MSILGTIKKEDVIFLMDFDYNNILGRLKYLLGKEASFFADIRVRQNDVTWSTKDEKEYGSFNKVENASAYLYSALGGFVIGILLRILS